MPPGLVRLTREDAMGRRSGSPIIVAVMLCALGAWAPLGGCASGEIEGELRLYLEQGNLDFYEEVLFPTGRRDVYDEIFVEENVYLPLVLPYQATRVDAIITQRGDLQITSHLTAGTMFRKHHSAADLEYLQGDDWNGGDVDAGSLLYEELEEPDASYDKLDEDIRLILLVNLPDDAGDGWSSDDWSYPVELMSNYGDTELDAQDQELAIPEEDIQLMSRLIVGGELFETVLGQRFDEAAGAAVDDDAPNLILDGFTLPGEDGRLGQATGSFDLMLEASSFSASSGVAMFSGSFEADVRADRWALEDLDVQEDIQESSAE